MRLIVGEMLNDEFVEVNAFTFDTKELPNYVKEILCKGKVTCLDLYDAVGGISAPESMSVPMDVLHWVQDLLNLVDFLEDQKTKHLCIMK